VLDEPGRGRLEAAYRSFGDDLWRAIVAYSGGSRDVADEAVAEAFAQAARGLSHIRDLRPWLFRAAFRIAAGELKRRGPTPIGDPENRRAGTGGTEEMTEMMELVHTLSPAQRRAFVLRDLLGYPTSEAATLAGSSEVSVRVHLHAARRRLRTQLEEAAR
jgi:RNA polymerase sigma-70 factor (ECF subfamily)